MNAESQDPTPAKQLELDWEAYRQRRIAEPHPDEAVRAELDKLKNELIDRQAEVDRRASDRRVQALSGLAIDHEGVVVRVEDHQPVPSASGGGRVVD